MNEAPTSLDEVCEAALLAAGEPLTPERLETLFDERERPSRGELRDALAMPKCSQTCTKRKQPLRSLLSAPCQE